MLEEGTQLKYIEEKINNILKLTETNCKVDRVEKGYMNSIGVALESNEYSDHKDDDEDKAKEVISVIFPFARVSKYYCDFYINEENITDFLTLLSLDNDSLKLYYELRK